MYRILTCLLLLGLTVCAYAQQNEPTLEAQSYALYQQAQWKPLLKLHKEMYASGIDYYYLRIRSAYAHTALQKPFRALAQIHKASKFWSNPIDADLYHTLLLLTQHPEEAELYTNIQKSKPFMQNISWESGLLNASGTQQGTSLMQNFNVYGELNRLKQIQYHTLHVQHRLRKGLHLEHALTTMQVNRNYGFAWTNNNTREFPNSVHQFQYYLGARIARKKGWMIRPALHALHLNYTRILAVPDPAGLNYTFVQNRNNSLQYVASAEVSKRIQNFKPTFSFAYSKLNEAEQWIAYTGITWFPAGDMRYYIHAGNSFFTESNHQVLIPRAMAGITLKKIWLLEAGCASGNMYNYHENNGAMIFNIPDKITFKGFATITCFAKPAWNIGLTYALQNREISQLYYRTIPNALPVADYVTQRYRAQGICLQFKYTFHSHTP
jgi:hypothetical protein